MPDKDEEPNHSVISISSPMDPANTEPASAKPEKKEPETKGLEFFLGLVLPLLVLLSIYGSGLLSAARGNLIDG